MILLVALLALAADPSPLAARMSCEEPAGPGRVKCEVEVRSFGHAIRWADVEILRTADFAAPLRGRVGPRDATAREENRWRWALALVAKARGTGEVLARVRALICQGDRCSAAQIEVTAPLAVGR